MDNVQKVKVALKMTADFSVDLKTRKLIAHFVVDFAKAVEFCVVKFRQKSVHHIVSSKLVGIASIRLFEGRSVFQSFIRLFVAALVRAAGTSSLGWFDGR